MARVPGTYRTIAVVAVMTGMIVPYPVSDAKTSARLMSTMVVAEANPQASDLGANRVLSIIHHTAPDQRVGARYPVQDGPC